MRSILLFVSCSLCIWETTYAQERLIYHDIRTDKQGNILPWYNDDPAIAFDHVIGLVWNFWDTMRTDMNGIPYYMNHQVWRPDFNDARGLGGDQIAMALSSWRLLYAYSGDERIKENMRFMADYYMTHGFSSKDCQWPDIPYPYNTITYSGVYDGDMVIGKNYTQPDKAGSLGIELVNLYKMTSNERFPNVTDQEYLKAAIGIANTLASNVVAGDSSHSPLPFKVNTITGETGPLKSNNRDGSNAGVCSYTTNWSGTMELWLQLIQLHQGKTAEYQKAFDTVLAWMKQYPMKSNRWGPFFEDIPGWSDTQINAMTWASFMMDHHELFPAWKKDVQGMIDWVYRTVGNDSWKKYGVTAVNEQTVYRVPGNSHTSRQASVELKFASQTGETGPIEKAVRQLSWATYMVDHDGKNRYPQDENWLTDGYGDYVRHYLRAMAARPELAPGNATHILSSTSVIQQVAYNGNINKFSTPFVRDIDLKSVVVYYRAFDKSGTEVLRLNHKPVRILLDGKPMSEGFAWKTLPSGGVLEITRLDGFSVLILDALDDSLR